MKKQMRSRHVSFTTYLHHTTPLCYAEKKQNEFLFRQYSLLSYVELSTNSLLFITE